MVPFQNILNWKQLRCSTVDEYTEIYPYKEHTRRQRTTRKLWLNLIDVPLSERSQAHTPPSQKSKPSSSEGCVCMWSLWALSRKSRGSLSRSGGLSYLRSLVKLHWLFRLVYIGNRFGSVYSLNLTRVVYSSFCQTFKTTWVWLMWCWYLFFSFGLG